MNSTERAGYLRMVALAASGASILILSALSLGSIVALSMPRANAADPRFQDLAIDNSDPFTTTAVTLTPPGIILMRTESGRQGNVRLFGVDIPQLTASCLSADGSRLHCRNENAEIFARILARHDNQLTCVLVSARVRPNAVQCMLGDEDLALVLIANGHSYADAKVLDEQAAGRPAWSPIKDTYLQAQNAARTNRRGIWSSVSPAEDYRLRTTKPLQ